jgi:dienelactone hydrolase
MTDPTILHLLYSVPTSISVEQHTYATDQGPSGFDLYRPTSATGPVPAVVFVTGLPDPGVTQMLGKPIKDWSSYQDWGRLVAAQGVAAIVYENRVPADVFALIRHVREHAAELGLDPARLGAWAVSGHVPMALAVLAREKLAAAVLLYGYMLDLDGSTSVADAAKLFYFAVPPVTLDELPRDLPILVVRAGRDATPKLDEVLVRFLGAARAHGLALTVVEHPEGPHAFDLVDDSPATKETIEAILAFVRHTLLRTT